VVHIGNRSRTTCFALQSNLALRGDTDCSFGVTICFADDVLGDETVQELLD
jgi:hypothetical protein